MDGRNDFDFLIGTWQVHHRRLKERLKGSSEWEEFEGDTVDRKILNGLGNMDENIIYRETGPIHAVTLRLFDPQAQEWSLYWATGISGILEVPMIGGFKHGLGEFYSQEVFEGRHIFSRFIWSEITTASCKWEQAFSADGGQTWETNWVMDFERA
ncbi:DUF1579 domain-containing protein [Candidatus Villigracilis affinis]|uniref:DUF1579 domain-containing protein n=1 Tax=Candidatus Villigracilis affinis TaxID=3140682 RepID=UPI001DBBA2D2|nr:DUF1579 domain-containing protein [Anaerolineales bacterium]